jgi:hypothetical protein
MLTDDGSPLGSHLGWRHAVACISIAESLPGRAGDVEREQLVVAGDGGQHRGSGAE